MRTRAIHILSIALAALSIALTTLLAAACQTEGGGVSAYVDELRPAFTSYVEGGEALAATLQEQAEEQSPDYGALGAAYAEAAREAQKAAESAAKAKAPGDLEEAHEGLVSAFSIQSGSLAEVGAFFDGLAATGGPDARQERVRTWPEQLSDLKTDADEASSLFVDWQNALADAAGDDDAPHAEWYSDVQERLAAVMVDMSDLTRILSGETRAAASLEAYLERVRPAFETDLEGLRAFVAGVQKCDESDPPEMGLLTDGCETYAAKLASAASTARDADPPPALQEANAALADSFAEEGAIYGEMADLCIEMETTVDQARYDELCWELDKLSNDDRAVRADKARLDWFNAVNLATAATDADFPDWIMDWTDEVDAELMKIE